MSQLIYSSGQDKLITRDGMAHLKTPDSMGSRHAPYSFGVFSNTVCDSIVKAGFKIEREEFAITKDEKRLFGLLQVSNGVANVPALSNTTALHRPGWSLLVGVRGAHDQRISRGLAIGSRVISCSNLCFHGDQGKWDSKQTTHIGDRIPGMVADAVAGLRRSAQTLAVDFDGFNRTSLSRDQGDSVLLDIFRSGGFSPSQLGRAIEDWDSCSVEEHTANGRNLWWLLNSATHALKPTGANNNHNDLRERSTIIYRKLQPAVLALAA